MKNTWLKKKLNKKKFSKNLSIEIYIDRLNKKKITNKFYITALSYYTHQQQEQNQFNKWIELFYIWKKYININLRINYILYV